MISISTGLTGETVPASSTTAAATPIAPSCARGERFAPRSRAFLVLMSTAEHHLIRWSSSTCRLIVLNEMAREEPFYAFAQTIGGRSMRLRLRVKNGPGFDAPHLGQLTESLHCRSLQPRARRGVSTCDKGVIACSTRMCAARGHPVGLRAVKPADRRGKGSPFYGRCADLLCSGIKVRSANGQGRDRLAPTTLRHQLIPIDVIWPTGTADVCLAAQCDRVTNHKESRHDLRRRIRCSGANRKPR
jgi:hypothetical protein